MKALVTLEVRGTDKHGSGHWSAPRGDRQHMGVDYVCQPGWLAVTPVAGVVTRLGWCYRDDPTYRYVEVTDNSGLRHRLFYVKPLAGLHVGDRVRIHDPVGIVQEIAARYPEITPHIHYEIKRQDGAYIKPA